MARWRRPSKERTIPTFTTETPAESGPKQEEAVSAEILTLGRRLEVKGDVVASADLRIEGTVAGRIMVGEHKVIVGVQGRVAADVHAKNVVVRGQVDGSVVADDKVEVLPTGTVRGDIHARRVVLAEGSTFNGKINKAPQATSEPARPREVVRPAAVPPPSPAAAPKPASAEAPQPTRPAVVFVPRTGSDKREELPPRHAPRRIGTWTLIETKNEVQHAEARVPGVDHDAAEEEAARQQDRGADQRR
jgi:cytoskeletal protein CcmA (bactofilin family)